MTSTLVFSSLGCGLALLATLPGVAGAQRAARSSSSCDGRVIRQIHVTTLRPPFSGEAAVWRRIARSIGLHHSTTDTAVVRRFLTLETGGPCTEFRLRESARLLREQPFLASARIRSVPDSTGGALVEVETTDEISAVASAALGKGRLSYLEIGNENMFGDAWLLAVHGSDRPLEGRSAGFRMSDFQFLGRPYQLDAQADWGQRTSAWLLAASHGYLTDLQKVAWEAGVEHVGQEFVDLHRGNAIDDLALKYRRYAADVGGVFKLGNLRTPLLLGGLITYLRSDPRGAVALTNHGIVSDTTLSSFYPKVTRTRLTGVGAWRNLNFIPVRGFEALTATQDVPTGFQLFGQLGHGVRTFGGSNDIYVLTDVIAGVGSAKTYSELHVINEMRREAGASMWDGIVSSSRLGFYWKPNELHLLRAWSDFGGGWRVQWPFQLALATDDERLIGYRGSLYGARRVGGGVELRRVLPNVTSRADVGAGAFVNVSRLWAGDAPFGVDTPLLPSGGLTVFGAFPKGSQRLLRIDLGVALRTGIARSGWEIRLTYKDANRTFRQEPRDVANAREQLVGPDVFRP
jgi:hypothetical protein